VAESQYWLRELKRRFRAAQQAKRSTSANPARQARKEEAVRAARRQAA
jgi:hypothetical protein